MLSVFKTLRTEDCTNKPRSPLPPIRSGENKTELLRDGWLEAELLGQGSNSQRSESGDNLASACYIWLKSVIQYFGDESVTAFKTFLM